VVHIVALYKTGDLKHHTSATMSDCLQSNPIDRNDHNLSG
jgi:hypothetical protein